jgi:hypothetical protein
MNKLKIQKVTHPSERLEQHEWIKLFNVSTGYVKPTKFFTGNDLDFSRFGASNYQETITKKIVKFFKLN